jgi:hypothetical protein
MIVNEYLMWTRHEEFQQEAERNRLLATRVSRPQQAAPLTPRYLYQLGGLLTRWGTMLETRFAPDMNLNHTQSIDCC